VFHHESTEEPAHSLWRLESLWADNCHEQGIPSSKAGVSEVHGQLYHRAALNEVKNIVNELAPMKVSLDDRL